MNLGFVDYSTRALRRAACEAEVRLNRRLAHGIYLGVVELVDGEPAVEMVRLDDRDSLLERLRRGELDAPTARRVGATLGAFHRDAERSDAIAAHGAPACLEHHIRENREQTRAHVGELVHPEVHRACSEASLAELARLAPALEARRDRIRDGHGDLRLEHIFLRGDRIEVIDCVEFSDAYRCSDVALDLAFLTMDLSVRGRADLAGAVVQGWLAETADPEAVELLPFFEAYRSIVRAKVAGLTLADPSLPPERRAELTDRARRHWLWAWGRLAPPERAPVLVGIGGRPGTGKTTVARALGEQGLEVIRSDVVRKELAGVSETVRLDPSDYGTEARDRVYSACLERAGRLLFAGQRVVVDASFARDAWRRALLDLGLRWGVPVAFLRCEAPEPLVLARLGARTGDASDADAAVYAATRWEPESAEVAARTRGLDTARPIPEIVSDAGAALRGAIGR